MIATLMKWESLAMLRFIIGLGAIIAGVGFIEGSNSFVIGVPLMVVGAMVMLWALSSSQITQ